MTVNAKRVITLFESLPQEEQMEVVSYLGTKSTVLQKGINLGPAPSPFGIGDPNAGVNIGPSPVNRAVAKPRSCPSCGKIL